MRKKLIILSIFFILNSSHANAWLNFSHSDTWWRTLTELKYYLYKGKKYYQDGNYKEALKSFKKALKIFKKNYGENNPNIAIIYDSLAIVSIQLKKYNEAFEFYDKALNIYKQNPKKNYLKIIETYTIIAELNLSLGYYSEAIEQYKKVLEIYKKYKKNNSDDTTIAYILYIIAGIYYKLGDIEKSLEKYKKALEIYEKNNNISIIIADIYSDTAKVYYDLGYYKKALKHYQKALEIYKGKNKFKTAITYFNIGNTLSSLYDKNAKKYYIKALESFKEIVENNTENKRYVIAEAYKHIAIISKILENEKKDKLYQNYELKGLVVGHNKKENSKKILKNYKKSLENYRKTLSKYKKEYGENYPEIDKIKEKMGYIYTELGKDEEAFKIFIGIRDDRKKMEHFSELANYYYKEKKYKYAFKYSLEISETYSNFVYNNIYLLPNDSKNNLFSFYKEKLGILFDSGYKLSFLYNDYSAPRSILNVWINFKSSSFDFDNFINTLYTPSNDQETIRKLNKLSQLREQLAKLYSNKPNNPKKFKVWENKVKSIQSEINSIKSQLAKKYNFNIKKVSYEDIQKHLKPDEIYIDFAKVGDYYFVITLDNKGNIHMAKIDATKVDNIVNQIKREISSIEYRLSNLRLTKKEKENFIKNLNSKEHQNKTIKLLLIELYKLVIERPLRRAITNKTTLIISPDGALRLIPFEALINSKTKNYLIVEKSIKYIPSGKEFVRLAKLNDKSKNRVVVFANPKFEINKPKEKKQKNINLYIPKTRAFSKLTDKFYPLPYTKIEAEHLKKYLTKIYGEWNIKIYMGDKATKENLFKEIFPEILHIATHGEFLNDKSIKNPMLKAMLVFAGANVDKERGVATALELMGLKLKGTELVVLSACDTGKVDIEDTESVSALTKAFILAGAKRVITSLWKLNDKEASELMDRFYRKVSEGKNYETALREAKLEMINKGKHPYFWASLLLFGR